MQVVGGGVVVANVANPRLSFEQCREKNRGMKRMESLQVQLRSG